jgi:hypothetical protein
VCIAGPTPREPCDHRSFVLFFRSFYIGLVITRTTRFFDPYPTLSFSLHDANLSSAILRSFFFPCTSSTYLPLPVANATLNGQRPLDSILHPLDSDPLTCHGCLTIASCAPHYCSWPWPPHYCSWPPCYGLSLVACASRRPTPSSHCYDVRAYIADPYYSRKAPT